LRFGHRAVVPALGLHHQSLPATLDEDGGSTQHYLLNGVVHLVDDRHLVTGEEPRRNRPDRLWTLEGRRVQVSKLHKRLENGFVDGISSGQAFYEDGHGPQGRLGADVELPHDYVGIGRDAEDRLQALPVGRQCRVYGFTGLRLRWRGLQQPGPGVLSQ